MGNLHTYSSTNRPFLQFKEITRSGQASGGLASQKFTVVILKGVFFFKIHNEAWQRKSYFLGKTWCTQPCLTFRKRTGKEEGNLRLQRTPRRVWRSNSGVVSMATVGRLHMEAGQPPGAQGRRHEEQRMSSGEESHSQIQLFHNLSLPAHLANLGAHRFISSPLPFHDGGAFGGRRRWQEGAEVSGAGRTLTVLSS